jgi:hypothetical protein
MLNIRKGKLLLLVFKMDNKVISGGFEEETFKIIDIKSW